MIYPEGGMPGLILRQKQVLKPRPMDTFKVQLVPLRAPPKIKIKGPVDVVAALKEMEDYDREYAKILHLDTKNQVMGIETISIGSLNSSIVHPRESVKGAILNNSSSVIFIHNHPSGICGPSTEDIEISKSLQEAFRLVGISLLDSLIVGKGCYHSLGEDGIIPGRMETRVKTVEEPTVSERIFDNLSRENRMRIARKITATIPAKPQESGKTLRWTDISRLPREERLKIARGITATAATTTGQPPLKDYLKAYNAFASREEAGLMAKIDRITADTSKTIPESQVIGAATPMNGYLVGYHLTDNPEEVIQRLKSNNLTALNPTGDLGGGLYISSVPEYWRVRSQRKWDFAKNLSQAQRQNLVNTILLDTRYRKGGGYLADFEIERLNRDLGLYIQSGDVTYLAISGNQPYNVRITEDITRKAGVASPKEPGLVETTLYGKFIDATKLYTNPIRDEVIHRAKAWGTVNNPDLMSDTRNNVNALLNSMGYSGMFTRSGMSTNPEMVIWDRKAIVSARKVV